MKNIGEKLFEQAVKGAWTFAVGASAAFIGNCAYRGAHKLYEEYKLRERASRLRKNREERGAVKLLNGE